MTAAITTWAILPVKAFGEAKSRLQTVLTPEGRSQLAMRLLRRTLDVLTEAAVFETIVVVSRDARALAIASEAGAMALSEAADDGLNPAIRQASALAQSQGAGRVLIMPCDLPLVTAADVLRMLDAGSERCVVMAPDRLETGTNALLLAPPDVIETAFGLDSFQKHLGEAAIAGVLPRVVRSEGLGFDLDVPGDYADLQRMAPDLWGEFVAVVAT